MDNLFTCGFGDLILAALYWAFMRYPHYVILGLLAVYMLISLAMYFTLKIWIEHEAEPTDLKDWNELDQDMISEISEEIIQLGFRHLGDLAFDETEDSVVLMRCYTDSDNYTAGFLTIKYEDSDYRLTLSFGTRYNNGIFIKTSNDFEPELLSHAAAEKYNRYPLCAPDVLFSFHEKNRERHSTPVKVEDTIEEIMDLAVNEGREVGEAQVKAGLMWFDESKKLYKCTMEGALVYCFRFILSGLSYFRPFRILIRLIHRYKKDKRFEHLSVD